MRLKRLKRLKGLRRFLTRENQDSRDSRLKVLEAQESQDARGNDLIFRGHNVVAEVLMDWCKKLKPASSVRSEPHIYPPGSTIPDATLMRGDVSVFGF